MIESRRIGNYETIEVIGRGGSATVYKAQDTESGRLVALKVLRYIPGDEAEFVKRFKQETRIAAGLEHPNIVPVYDSGEYEGNLYMAMDLIGEGYNLRQLLEEKGRLLLQEALPILKQLASALGYLHQLASPLTHRDIKPANVLLERDDDNLKVALADFGLVRSADASTRTETGAIGTALYMAPEQADKRLGEVTPLTDVYGLGVVVYEMLTGHVPFNGDVMSVLFDHCHKRPPPAIQFVPDMDEDLVEVLEHALAKSPEERYPSASALIEDLESAMEAIAKREKQRKELTVLLGQAQAASEADDWVAVQNVLAQAARIDFKHPEVVRLMEIVAEKSRKALEEDEALRRYVKYYREGEQALSDERWKHAMIGITEITGKTRGFPELDTTCRFFVTKITRCRG